MDCFPEIGPSHKERPLLADVLACVHKWVSFSDAYVIYDSDRMPFTQSDVQNALVGRSRYLGVLVRGTEVFGSFHPAVFRRTTADSGWTHDDRFFVFRLVTQGRLVAERYFKRPDVYCHLRSMRYVTEDKTFYRVNNAFFLTAPMSVRNNGFWGDFFNDYTPSGPEEWRMSFALDRLVVFQLL